MSGRIRFAGVKRSRKGGAVFSNNFLTLPNTPSSREGSIPIPYTSIRLTPIGLPYTPVNDIKRPSGNNGSAVSHIPGVNYDTPPLPPRRGVSALDNEPEDAAVNLPATTPAVRPAARPSTIGSDTPEDLNTELTGTTPLDGFTEGSPNEELSGRDKYFKEHVEPLSDARLPAAFLAELIKGRDYLKHVSDEVKNEPKYVEPKTGIPLLMEEIRKGVKLRPVGPPILQPEVSYDDDDDDDDEGIPPPLPPRRSAEPSLSPLPPLPPPPPPPPPPPTSRRRVSTPRRQRTPIVRAKSTPFSKDALLREIERGFQLKPIKKPARKRPNLSSDAVFVEALKRKFKNALDSENESGDDEW